MKSLKNLLFLIILIFVSGLNIRGQEMNIDKNTLPGFKSGFIEVEDGRLYYEEAGSGETMIFLHDGLIHSVVWDEQFEYFSKKYRVIRYDRRGFGKSPLPEKPYSDVADLYKVFENFKIEKAILVGMSAGSRLALDFAVTYPEKIAMLILVSPVVSGLELTEHFINRGGHRPPDLDFNSDAYRHYWVTTDPYEIWEGNTDTRELTKKILDANPHNTDPRIFQLMQRSTLAYGQLDKITAPTFLIVGESDIADIHTHAGAILARIKGARRAIILKAGHRVPMEQPQALIERMSNMIGGAKFYSMAEKSGIAAAVELYRKTIESGDTLFRLKESEINYLGYNNLQQGNIKDALLLFKLYVDEFPESYNAYDSYAEALLADGDTTRSIINYQKSLELNPQNSNATEMLNRIKK